MDVLNSLIETHFYSALLVGNYTAAKRLLQQIDVNSLSIAAWSPGVVRFLLENGLEIDRQDKYGMTPMMLLCEFAAGESLDFRDLFFLLLSYSPNLELQNNQGETVYDFLFRETLHPEVQAYLEKMI